MKLLILSIPLPFITIILGWSVTEIGRQPWIVYGLLRTANGISTVPTSDVMLSIILISGFYLVLMIFEIYLMKKAAVDTAIVNVAGGE